MSKVLDDAMFHARGDGAGKTPYYFPTSARKLTRRGILWLGLTCNLRCHFCYFLDRIENPAHPEHAFMSLDKAKAIQRLQSAGFGGSADTTIRQIADEASVHPSEIRRILHDAK